MKRIRRGAWLQLVAALLALVAIGTSFHFAEQQLAQSPRSIIELDYAPKTRLFSPDSKLLLTCSRQASRQCREIFLIDEGGDTKLEVWDIASGTRRLSLDERGLELRQRPDFIDPRDGCPIALQFSPDSQLLAVVTIYLSLTVWSTSTGERQFANDLHEIDTKATDARFTPDGRFLFVSLSAPKDTPAQTVVWDLASHQERGRIDAHLMDIHFSPDGKRFTTREVDPVRDRLRVKLWELSPDSGPELITERAFAVKCVAVSPDLATLATVRVVSDLSPSFRLQLWDLATGAQKANVVETSRSEVPGSLRFSPSGRFITEYRLGDRGEELQGNPLLWDTQPTSTRVSGVSRWSILPPGDRWLISRAKTSVDLRDVSRNGTDDDWSPTNAPTPTSMTPRWHEVVSSPDGSLLLVTGYDTTRKMSFLEAVLAGQPSKINATVNCQVARLWDADKRQELMPVSDCQEATFSPDGRTLAAVDSKNRIGFWTMPPPSRAGAVLPLTVLSWVVVLLVARQVMRGFRRGRRSSTLEAAPLPTPPPKGESA
jgi:WD40 repeat protein